MALNCLGNEVESGCVKYTGPAIPAFNIQTGDPLDDVLLKIVAGITTPIVVDDSTMTTDNITSTSSVRNIGSINASKIIKRDFAYKLASSGVGSTVFNWDLTPVIRQLPSDYEAVLTKVKVSGKPTNGSNVVVDSRSPGASLVIPVDRYPVTVDLTVRVTTPSGNVDLESTINLVNPSNTGSFRAVLDANDLNPQSGVLSLTEHLNSLESQLHGLSVKQATSPDLSSDLEVQKQIMKDVQDELVSLRSQIDSLSK